jgi:hypothetical protein
MHYLIAGLAKSGTTRLFSQLKSALDAQPGELLTYFEPDGDAALADILAQEQDTLSKVLIGRVSAQNEDLQRFDRHVLIYRDPRDQFLSMLLYLFYDFQLNGDGKAYAQAREALARKVAAPADESTIELYNLIAGCVGRGPVAVFKRLHEVQLAYESAFRPFRLRYEDLLRGLALPELSAYLGVAVGEDVQVPGEYARVARSRGFGEWRHWLNDDDLAFVNREWGDTIRRLGYELADTAQDLQIDTRLSLDYVAQFDPARGAKG